MLAVSQLGRKNLGITCDLCHMMMADEYPAHLISMALEAGCLFGLHLNDGYARGDDGLAVGSVNVIQTLRYLNISRTMIIVVFSIVIHFLLMKIRWMSTE